MTDSLNNKELVAVGHELAKALSSDTPIIDIAKVLSRLADRLDVTAAALREKAKQRDALATENAGLKAKGREVLTEACSIYEKFNATVNPENGDFMDGQTLHEFQFLLDTGTPNHDAFLAEVRASAIPEGYVLVPQEMHLSSEAMKGICFHCGDGGFAFGEFTDGLLFVGAIDDSDGQKIHRLHIATADHQEEGCATVCAFLPMPTEGTAQ